MQHDHILKKNHFWPQPDPHAKIKQEAINIGYSIIGITIPGPRGHGRPRKSWSECVKADVDVCNLEGIDPQNREALRSGVRRTSQLQLTLGTGKLSAV